MVETQRRELLERAAWALQMKSTGARPERFAAEGAEVRNAAKFRLPASLLGPGAAGAETQPRERGDHAAGEGGKAQRRSRRCRTLLAIAAGPGSDRHEEGADAICAAWSSARAGRLFSSAGVFREPSPASFTGRGRQASRAIAVLAALALPEAPHLLVELQMDLASLHLGPQTSARLARRRRSRRLRSRLHPDGPNLLGAAGARAMLLLNGANMPLPPTPTAKCCGAAARRTAPMTRAEVSRCVSCSRWGGPQRPAKDNLARGDTGRSRRCCSVPCIRWRLPAHGRFFPCARADAREIFLQDEREAEGTLSTKKARPVLGETAGLSKHVVRGALDQRPMHDGADKGEGKIGHVHTLSRLNESPWETSPGSRQQAPH